MAAARQRREHAAAPALATEPHGTTAKDGRSSAPAPGPSPESAMSTYRTRRFRTALLTLLGLAFAFANLVAAFALALR